MGALFGKHSKRTTPSRITDHDRAVLQLKQQRDRLKQYQKRIELQLENDRQLAKKCLLQGRKDRAKLLLRKKKYQETMLENADKQLDNLEKLTADLEFVQVEMKVLDGLKQGNAALKKVHELLDINEVGKIMDETREGVEKQQEIDAILTDVLTAQDEEDVLAELDALEAEEQAVQLPDVPNTEPIVADEDPMEQETEDETKEKTRKHKAKKQLVEA